MHILLFDLSIIDHNINDQFKPFIYIIKTIWDPMKIYLIRKQNTSNEINGLTKLHLEATQEHSALFLQKFNTALNRVHASCSVTTSDFLS